MVDLNRLEAKVNDWTEAMGIKNFQGPDESLQFKNAFAHAYASANIAYDNNR